MVFTVAELAAISMAFKLTLINSPTCSALPKVMALALLYTML